MKMRATLVGLLLLFTAATAMPGAVPDHSRWDAILKEYVTTAARVDYRRLQAGGQKDLDEYLRQMANAWPDDMREKENKAALINAYNALTVRWILLHYPVESIWSTRDPFKAVRHTLNGESLSLDDIETRLRAMGDPRIHGALVCAARSCPPLRREAYVAERIDDQLDDNVRRWLADVRLNEFSADRHLAEISAIFEWYAGDFDFEGSGGVRNFLARYAPPEASAALAGFSWEIRHKRYNWGLNDTSAGAHYSQLRFYLDSAKNGYLVDAAKTWFLDLGRKHGANPFIFGGIYVGAIPFFSLSVAWLIRNVRRRRSAALPALCAGFCFVSAYLYLFIAGKNIPLWVYLFLAGMIALGAYSAIRKIRVKLTEGGRA